MARTPEQIQAEIISSKEANADLADLNSNSKTAIWRLITYVIAFAVSSLEKLFDLHKTEVEERISLLKPHTQRWYRHKALAFQSGFNLVADTDYFDNKDRDPQVVEDSKIIKYAAVTEADTESRIIIKIATEKNGKLGPISQEQKQSFESYIAEIKDAGVLTSVTNFLPDRLYLNMKIYRDPLVLGTDGSSILSGGKPVEEAIKQYLKELPFNGELVLAHLIDRLQQVPGVKIPDIESAKSSWINAQTNDYDAGHEIKVREIPVSGYFEIVDFNHISYVV